MITPSSQLATHDQICMLLRKTSMQIDDAVKKSGLPREKGKAKQYNLQRVIYWLLDQHKKEVEEIINHRLECSVGEIADLFNQEIRTIDLNVKKLGMPRKERGVFNVVDVFKWKIKQLQKQIEDIKTGDGSYADAEKRDMIATAALKEIKLAHERGEVMNRSDAASMAKDAVMDTNKKMDGWPRKLALRLIMKETPLEIEQIIQGEVDAIRNELSRIPDTLFGAGKLQGRSESSLEDVYTTETPDTQPVGRTIPHTIKRNIKQRKR